MDKAAYEGLCAAAKTDPDKFWGEVAKRLTWDRPFSKVADCSFVHPVQIKWYLDGKLNASFNCLDRHLAKFGDKPAIIWQPDNPQEAAVQWSYKKLHLETCKVANGLSSLGVKKGDRVTIYLPMLPEAVATMLACARIGAVHSVVFAGFSPEAIADRIDDGQSEFVVTCNEGLRAGKTIPLKANMDRALEIAKTKVKSVVVVRRTESKVPMLSGRDVDYHTLIEAQSSNHTPQPMDAEDPLFILYTSGSTAKPKGALHTTGGYLVYASYTHELIFDYKPGQIYWCTADVGWVTGHSYIVYGPLSNAATVLIYEGVPNYPDCGRFWQIVDQHQVEILYTAPTALRALIAQGDSFVKKYSRASLKILGTVGEPINPDVWNWYHQVVGDSRCPIVDTWWQTETGGILISPVPNATPQKPGSATQPLPGIVPVVVDETSAVLIGNSVSGHLCIAKSWPGQMRTVFGDHDRFEKTYFSTHKGMYFTGDGCRRDADGDYWITGRVDDVINVAGHRIGTAEIENALVHHALVAEAAVVGFPHPIKGQGIFAYVTVKHGHLSSEELMNDLKRELVQIVRDRLSPIATPDQILWAPALPKTRSGKIMRRILRKIAEQEYESIGDTTTLADPSVVDDLINRHKAALTT